MCLCMSLLHSWSGYIIPHQLVYPSTSLGVLVTTRWWSPRHPGDTLPEPVARCSTDPAGHWWSHLSLILIDDVTLANRKHGKTWQNHGKPWQNMAKPWQNMAKPWQNMAKPWRNMPKPWQNHQHPRTAFWITSQKTWFARLALCWKQVLVCIAQGQPAGFLHTFTWQVIMMRWMEEILHQVIGGLHMFIPLFTRISRGSTIQKKWLQDFFHPNMIKHDPVKSCPNNCGSPMGSE